MVDNSKIHEFDKILLKIDSLTNELQNCVESIDSQIRSMPQKSFLKLKIYSRPLENLNYLMKFYQVFLKAYHKIHFSLSQFEDSLKRDKNLEISQLIEIELENRKNSSSKNNSVNGFQKDICENVQNIHGKKKQLEKNIDTDQGDKNRQEALENNKKGSYKDISNDSKIQNKNNEEISEHNNKLSHKERNNNSNNEYENSGKMAVNINKDGCPDKMNDHRLKNENNPNNIEQSDIIVLLQTIELVDELRLHLKTLLPYNDINIVISFNDKIQTIIQNHIKHISKHFFLFLRSWISKNIEKDTLLYEDPPEHIQKLSIFLSHEDNDDFFSKYSDVFLTSISFKDMKMDHTLRTLDRFSSYKSFIISLNEFFNPTTNPDAFDKFIYGKLLSHFKESLLHLILSLETKFKVDNIRKTIHIYKVINQDDIKCDFQEISPELSKIFENLCFLFVDYIQKNNNMNECAKNEEFIDEIADIVNDIRETNFTFLLQDCDRFKSIEMLQKFLQDVCERKIDDFSERLKGIQKNAYLINNYNSICRFVCENNLKKLRSKIDGLVIEIIQMWKTECKKRIVKMKKNKSYSERAFKFLDVNLEIQKNYHLPEKLRRGCVDRIKEIVYDYVTCIGYDDTDDLLESKIENLFTG